MCGRFAGAPTSTDAPIDRASEGATLDGYAGSHSNQLEPHGLQPQVSPTPALIPRNAGRLTVALCVYVRSAGAPIRTDAPTDRSTESISQTG